MHKLERMSLYSVARLTGSGSGLELGCTREEYKLMTAGNRQRFIIINLRACIRIYDVTLPSAPRPSSPVSSSSAPTRWQCARFFSRSAIKFIPVARRQVMRVLQKGQASKCRLRNKNRAMNKILLAWFVFEHMCGCWDTK